VSWRHVAATALLIAGGSLQLLAVLGLVLMRDAYDRLHLLGVAGFGALLIAVAIVIRESFSLIADKALFTGVIVVLVGPIVGHVTARSLRIREHGDWRAGIERHREKGRS
jgi:monovalent cation/proton antiporter MnhG/PhaG subunit